MSSLSSTIYKIAKRFTPPRKANAFHCISDIYSDRKYCIRTVYVGFAYEHHKETHAGYQRVKDYANYDYKIDLQDYFDQYYSTKRTLWIRIKRKLSRMVFGIDVPPLFIAKIWWMSLWNSNLVFHFVYAESLFLPFKRYVNKAKAVITVHQPLSVLKDWGEIGRLASADNIILVGNSELDAFMKVTGRDNVTYIPHGICTDFYCPDTKVTKERTVLTVGNWLRDYHFANRVYQRLLADDPNLRIVVVTNPKNRELLDEHERLTFLSGISDEELRKLYQQCSVLFLPLTRYTANNALLEAGACGCNIVISSDAPDNSYIPEDLLNITPLQEDAAVEKIQSVLNPTYNTALADYVKEHYSWERVGSQTEDFLRNA